MGRSSPPPVESPPSSGLDVAPAPGPEEGIQYLLHRPSGWSACAPSPGGGEAVLKPEGFTQLRDCTVVRPDQLSAFLFADLPYVSGSDTHVAYVSEVYTPLPATSEVPLPGAAVLLVTGLLFLKLFRRRVR